MTQQNSSPVAEAIALQPTDVYIDQAARVGEVLKRWHDESHEGAYKWCQEQPCRGVRRALGDVE